MSKLSSHTNFPYDAEPSVLLRDAADGAETATGTEAAKPLPAEGEAYWQNDGPAFEYVTVVFNVQELNIDPGNSYVLEVEVSDDEAFTTPVSVATTGTRVTSVGTYAVPLHRTQIPNSAKFVRVKHNLSGGTASINYAAWMVPTV